ncbi:hypothetical protein [Rubrivirga marina]|uniref:6-bladed beta-propeller n=1 Tax=Rubrivirga marina TaxID=1196024 RepID=A0A271IVR0_9BACT|nr:hypothetical protein [Rubrivirga marina]PAP75200.1 hypothetical protein BSZ37_01450 [Rubrivirga marina]
MTRAALAVTCAVALAGCLPSSQKQNSRAISAADSLSAEIAATVAVDTLVEVWTARPPTPEAMPVPTSLAWAGDTLAVVETQTGGVHRFSGAGAYLDQTALPAGSYPYLAGTLGDTVVVLAKGRTSLLWVVPGEGVAREVPVPTGTTNALAAPGLLAARVGGGPDTLAPAVVRLGEDGAEVARRPLAGPAWRSLGFLRLWAGRVAALSGYRPVVDVLNVQGGLGPADTLSLQGFDSPQLPRSAQFVRGEVDEPPLLTSSAAALDGRLFVLNLRSDHVRLDVYDRDGRIERVLVSPTRGFEVDVATDLAVRPGPGGTVDLAVLMARPPGVLQTPESRIVLYRWRGASREA